MLHVSAVDECFLITSPAEDAVWKIVISHDDVDTKAARPSRDYCKSEKEQFGAVNFRGFRCSETLQSIRAWIFPFSAAFFFFFVALR